MQFYLIYLFSQFNFLSLQDCGLCGKNFANVYRLQRHMLCHEESSSLRRFKCSDCGKAFKFKHHLKVLQLAFYNILYGASE